MPPVDAREPKRNYPVPHAGNDIADDFARLISALTAIGVDVDALLTTVGGKAPMSHGHDQAAITGLVAALAGKAATDHGHALASLSDVAVAGATTYQVLGYFAGVWRPWTVDLAHVTGSGIVRSDVDQTLDASAKARARTNIGAVDATAVSAATTAATAAQTTANSAGAAASAAQATANAALAPLTGGSMSYNLTIAKDWASVILDKPTSGTASQIVGRKGGKNRWVVQLGDANAETGGNAGSNWAVIRYDDAGNYLDTPLFISRDTGLIGAVKSLNLAAIAPASLLYMRSYNNSVASGTEARIEVATGTPYAQLFLLVHENGTAHADATLQAGGGTNGLAFHCWNPAGKYVWSVNGSAVMYVDAAGVLTANRVQAPTWDLLIEDQKASGTSGGASASGTQTRALNTIVKNTVGAALSGNVVTFPAGTWAIEWGSPASGSGSHKSVLVDTATGAVIAVGRNEYTYGTSQTASGNAVELTFAAPTTVRIDHHIAVANAAGLGQPASTGSVEIYSWLRARRTA